VNLLASAELRLQQAMGAKSVQYRERLLDEARDLLDKASEKLQRLRKLRREIAKEGPSLTTQRIEPF
jgi:hypothetical protein